MATHLVQVLRAAGKTLEQVVAETWVSQSSVQRIEREPAIEEPGDLRQACERGVGRPSVVARWRERVTAVLAAEPGYFYRLDWEGRRLRGEFAIVK